MDFRMLTSRQSVASSSAVPVRAVVLAVRADKVDPAAATVVMDAAMVAEVKTVAVAIKAERTERLAERPVLHSICRLRCHPLLQAALRKRPQTRSNSRLRRQVAHDQALSG